MTSDQSGDQRSDAAFALTDVPGMLYNALRQSIDDPFRILDQDYRLVWINRPEFCQQIGQVCYENVYAKTQPCHPCPVTMTFKTGQPATIDKRGIRPDGSEMWRRVCAYPVFNENASVMYAITIGHDYTDAKLDLAEQQQRIDRLETALHEVTRVNIDALSDASRARPAIDLTRRELQVLRLMAGGLTNIEIAQALSISPHTVKTHVVRIFNKLGVNDRTQAATMATRVKLI